MKSVTRQRILFFLGLALVLSARTVTAHEGHAHTAMGTVAAITAEHLEVKTSGGKAETFVLTADTKLDRAGKAETSDKVVIGERVVVHYKEVGGKNVAQHVQLAARGDVPKTTERGDAEPGSAETKNPSS